MDVDQKQSSAAPSSPEGRSSDASSETVGGRSSSKTARSGKQLKPGARTVQNLTKEQLERKRGNDREAQRAIRRRTKDLIKSLQNQVDDMKQSGNPQRVAHLVEERDRLIQENMALKGELQQRSEAGDSPSQVNPADTSSTGSTWSQVRRTPGVGNIEIDHPALQSPPVLSPGSSSTHSHASGIQPQSGGGYSPVHAYSRQSSYSQIPSEPVAARHASYDYPARSTMNEAAPRQYPPPPQAPPAHAQIEPNRPTYSQLPPNEVQPPQTAFNTRSSSQPRLTAFHQRRPESPPGQHTPTGYTEPQWTADRNRPLPKYDPHHPTHGGFSYPSAMSMEHSQQGPHPQHEGQNHAAQYPHQPGYVVPPPSASQSQQYPPGLAQYGPIGHPGYGHPNSQQHPPPHSPHPEQQRDQRGGPHPQPPGYFSYYAGS